MRYYYTPHTILQLLRVACEPSADHVVVVVMFTCFHIYLLSVRTLCDPLYLPTLILMGACNQGERFFIFILVASLVDTRSVACVSVTMKQCVSVSMCTHYTFKKVRAKKNPSCDESFLICPIRYSHWYSFKVSNHWNNIRLLLI